MSDNHTETVFYAIGDVHGMAQRLRTLHTSIFDFVAFRALKVVKVLKIDPHSGRTKLDIRSCWD